MLGDFASYSVICKQIPYRFLKKKTLSGIPSVWQTVFIKKNWFVSVSFFEKMLNRTYIKDIY